MAAAAAVRGGGSVDEPDDSDITGGALTAGSVPPASSGTTAAPGADRPSPDSRATTEDSRVQRRRRRRSGELDRKAHRSSAGEDRSSRQRPLRDHRQSGSSSGRLDPRPEQSSAALGKSEPPSPPRREQSSAALGQSEPPSPPRREQSSAVLGEPEPPSPSPETAVTSNTAAHTECAAAPEAGTEDQLTHRELETVYRDTLSGLLASDPLLSDLSASLTAAELRSLTALEHGTAMAVLVSRGDRLTRVIVQRSATVRELKAALRSAVELELWRRGGRRRAISWRYVWRAHWLAFQGRRLTDDNASLEQLGLGNKAEVCFVKRIRAKRGQRDKKGGQV